jgi:hypothetical protein
MMGVVNSGGYRGLGATYKIDCSGGATNGQTIDCDSFSNFFNSSCWNLCNPETLAPGTVAPVGGASDVGGATTPPPLVSPSLACSFLTCDSTGTVTLGSGNMVWILGAVLAVMLFMGSRR